MIYRDIAAAQLRVDEGVRSKIYEDTLGIPTIGYGRNLRDVGLRPDEIELLFANDLKAAESAARALVAAFPGLSENRKAVLVNMAFNLGEKLGAFSETLRHINAGDFDKAADAMLDSLWAKQVGKRAARLATMMREG